MSSHRAALAPIDEAPLATRDDPRGLAHDPRTGALFVADGASGTIVRLHAGQVAPVARIEPGGLGGIALAPDGTLYVVRVGHGHAGAIVRVGADRTEVLERMATRYWRSGIAYDAGEHALYTTQFVMGGRGAFDGAIVGIDLATGHASMLLDGFLKPTGIAKLGATLVVADARQRAVFRIELVAGRAVSRLQLAADVERPDAVCACGPDAVLLTSFDDETGTGTVRRLGLDGRHTVIARGAWEPRGVATDGARAFVAIPRRVLAFAL